MQALILAGGKGEKMWPYNEIRNKCMIPISNKPIIQYLVDDLKEISNHEIFILGHHFMDEINHLFRNEKGVHGIVCSGASRWCVVSVVVACRGRDMRAVV